MDETEPKKELSRDAQIVAAGLFGLGSKASVSFQRPHIIHPRTRAAIEELKAAGMIEDLPAHKLARGAEGWRGTEKIGFPLADFKKMEESESFPITTE